MAPITSSSLCSSSSSSLTSYHSFEPSIISSPQSSIVLNNSGRVPSSDDMMDTSGDTEDVSTVMTEVLHRMDRIVEHFREKGENDAANGIAKHTIATIKIFNDTVMPWDVATATMRPPQPQNPNQATSSTAAAHNGHTTGSAPNPPVATSWAAVAAVAPAADNNLVKYPPNDTSQTTMKEVQPTPIVAEVNADRRVVWVRGWTPTKSLGEVTDRIGQGPIYSMAFSERDSAVCVIFQLAYSAKALCEDDQQYTKSHGHSRFGPGCDVVEGLPFPDNDDIRRMATPINERRRLTFARSQLFQNGMTEERFKSDIYSIVGEKNVELVWLFNTGNATVVFSAVPLARLVRSEFIKISRSPGSPYQGVVITFSHDPCERPMTLITQMQHKSYSSKIATYGREGVAAAGVTTRGGSSSRRSIGNDSDGWQTVSRRR